MKSGKLRHVIEIKRVTPADIVADEHGDTTPSEQDSGNLEVFATRRAKLTVKRGTEQYQRVIESGSVMYEALMRRVDGVTADMIAVVDGSMVCNILSAYDPDGRNRDTILILRARITDALASNP